MFAQAVGMTASDLLVSDVVKVRQNNLNFASLIFHKKAKCLLKNCAIYSRIYIEFQLLHFFGAQILQ